MKWNNKSEFKARVLELDKEIGGYVIVHELLHFNIPDHGKLWKSLMSAYLGDYKNIEEKLNKKRLSEKPTFRIFQLCCLNLTGRSIVI